MSIKLLLLKSGEEVIADIKEMIIGGEDESTNRVIGYYLKNPCAVKIKESNPLSDNTEVVGRLGYEVSLYKWIPLSADEQITIPTDWVVTMVNPVSKLENMYTEDIINNGKNDQSSSPAEQSDSHQPD
jgi:hypothetical protein